LIKILILGSSGLVGHQLFKLLNEAKDLNRFKLYKTSRFKNSSDIYFDSLEEKSFNNIKKIRPVYIINCIGLIKPRIDYNSTSSLINCLKVNSLLPMQLSNHFKNCKIIHITTNGVFDGKKGNYSETDIHDCLDFYGKSKSIGEIKSKNIMNLRCSVIGFENATNYSLLNWYLKKKNTLIKGYSNHIWNGITSVALSKIIMGIIRKNLFKSGTFHLISSDKISKYDLMKLFNKYFNQKKSKIISLKHSISYKGTLKTNYKRFNLKMWNSAGYNSIPKIDFLIRELSLYQG
jgi:dTDP-4-dehydrorhamnose reductase